MNILSIGLDKKILDKTSENFQRQKEYAGLVDEYHVMIFGPKKEIQEGNLFVYGSGGRNKISRFFKAYKKARKILSNKDLSDWLITTQDPFFTGFLGYLLKISFYIKLHVQIHGLEKFYGLRKLLAKLVISKADGFRVVSQRLKKKLIDEFGVEENKITTVPIYTEITQKSIEKLQKSTEEKFVFLTVGRLVPIKNIEMQILAFVEVNKKYPNTELWIVGDGPEKYKIQDTRNKIQKPVGIKLFGWQDNLEKFYQRADAFLLTSNYEGWGLVVIEAATYGLPIIMTDVGCAGEVIKNGESGIVIPIGDRKALEGAMIKIIEDSELRKKLGQGAQKAVKQLPSKQETLELYRKSWQTTLECE